MSPLLDGEINNRNLKYNAIVYSYEDVTITGAGVPAFRFTDGIMFSVKLKKGFNRVYVQESSEKRLVTTSVTYQSLQLVVGEPNM